MARGICRFCGCAQLRACPGGCAWLDRTHTVCTRCGGVLAAWCLLPRPRPARAAQFARGYFAALRDPRAVDVDATGIARNPFKAGGGGEAHRYWRVGYALGERIGRVRLDTPRVLPLRRRAR